MTARAGRTAPSAVQASLASMRLSMAAFFAVWAIEKFVAPEAAIRVPETFYGTTPTTAALAIVGVLQLVLIAAFAAGYRRAYTTGAMLVIHAAAVLSTVPRLVDPYTLPNHLFWAGVPLVSLLLALFLLRDQDTRMAFPN